MNNNTGFNAKSLIAIVTGFCIVWFVLGISLVPETDRQRLLDSVVGSIDEWVVKLGIWMLWIFVWYVLIFRVILWTYLLGEIEAKHNNSHAILLAGLIGTGAMLVVFPSGVSMRDYLISLSWRGSVVTIMSVLVTYLWAAFILRIWSLSDFVFFIKQEDNDSHVIVLVATILAVFFVGMNI